MAPRHWSLTCHTNNTYSFWATSALYMLTPGFHSLKNIKFLTFYTPSWSNFSEIKDNSFRFYSIFSSIRFWYVHKVLSLSTWTPTSRTANFVYRSTIHKPGTAFWKKHSMCGLYAEEPFPFPTAGFCYFRGKLESRGGHNVLNALQLRSGVLLFEV